MGSRAACALAKQLSSDGAGDAVQGLVCLSFPLHPPGQKQAHRQRSEDLRGLPEEVPVLFVSGTEDSMCDRVRMSKTNHKCRPGLRSESHTSILYNNTIKYVVGYIPKQNKMEGAHTLRQQGCPD